MLSQQLNSAENISVVGTGLDGEQAYRMAAKLKPDVITLDQAMPSMGGLEALERIMHECPIPVVMISGVSSRAATLTRQALDLGAVDFVLKYIPGTNTNPDILYREIIAKVRAAARVKVIRSLRTVTNEPQTQRKNGKVKKKQQPVAVGAQGGQQNNAGSAVIVSTVAPKPRGIVVIGASTGGPLALRELLAPLPANFNYPIVVVQHIPATFTDILADHLDKYAPLNVIEAQEGDYLESGVVYVAPGDKHLVFRPNGQVKLTNADPINGHRPAIDVTMRSAAEIYGSRTRGIILTGMGEDGAQGLLEIRNKGGKTYAQDAESCVVNGMPQRAIELGGVEKIAPPAEIADFLMRRK